MYFAFPIMLVKIGPRNGFVLKLSIEQQYKWSYWYACSIKPYVNIVAMPILLEYPADFTWTFGVGLNWCADERFWNVYLHWLNPQPAPASAPLATSAAGRRRHFRFLKARLQPASSFSSSFNVGSTGMSICIGSTTAGSSFGSSFATSAAGDAGISVFRGCLP